MKRAIKQPIPFVGTPVIRYYARCFIYFLIFKTMPQKTQILTIFYIIEKIGAHRHYVTWLMSINDSIRAD